MRLAFIFMVLANLVYFAWHYPRDGNADSVVVPLPPKTARGEHSIVLLHELEQLRRPEAKTPAAVSPVTTAPAERPTEALVAARCFSVGPFKAQDSAEQAAARLEAYGAETHLQSTEKQDRLRYWVTYTAASAEEARDVFDKLRGKGMKDMFLMSEDKNTLSLGLFRGESTARRRVAQIQAMGVAAEVKEKYRATIEYRLDIRESPDSPLTDAAWADVLSGTAGALKQPTECP